MNASELLQMLAVGTFLGSFGQGLRTIVGIKKASDEAAAGGSTLREEGLDVSGLVLSLFNESYLSRLSQGSAFAV